MKSWKTLLAIIALTVVIPLYFVILDKSLIWGIVLVLWVAAVLAGGFVVITRRWEKQEQALLRSFEETAIRTLNHHRHDWMNDLQILYGYIQLGKIDKAVQCVDRIKERMNQESKISKLGIPSLVFYLQSFRTSNSNLELEIAVDQHMQLEKLSPQDGAELAAVIMQTIRAYQYSGKISWGDTRKLLLSLRQDGQEIIVSFEEDGSIGSSELLKEQIYNVVQGKRMKAEQIHPSHASFELRVPCEL
ncbi:Spo0B domain-containing protein [Paenibacillus sp. KQZ6P-2]|uniref:Spo0B domain-containing protein n=1 Tax=Paenibacillus mangrovi TaxID=2931978 RepID=A0A9X1WS99_9BACL|nr:Spo0B domain-containing protein [Paenibacillus mangrovi]MCJ8013781.1 Spo0B domain-containing protein [Paenibacillus mangrovi]